VSVVCFGAFMARGIGTTFGISLMALPGISVA